MNSGYTLFSSIRNESSEAELSENLIKAEYDENENHQEITGEALGEQLSQFGKLGFHPAVKSGYYALQTQEHLKESNRGLEKSLEKPSRTSSSQIISQMPRPSSNFQSRTFHANTKVPPKSTPSSSSVVQPMHSCDSESTDQKLVELKQIYLEACNQATQKNYAEAFEKANLLYKKLRESNAYETHAYLKTVELIAKILCAQKKYQMCSEFLVEVTEANEKCFPERSPTNLISRWLLALLRTKMGQFQKALEDFEFLLNFSTSANGTLRENLLSEDQLLEIYHAKAGIHLKLGQYDESLKTLEELNIELRGIKNFNSEQISLVAVKKALVALRCRSMWHKLEKCLAVFKTCEFQSAITKNRNIFGIAVYVKQRWMEIEDAIRWKEHPVPYYVANPAGDFFKELNERGVNIFAGLKPKVWDFLFG